MKSNLGVDRSSREGEDGKKMVQGDFEAEL